MASRLPGDRSEIIGVGEPVAWDDGGGERFLETNLTADQIAVLGRVAKGQGLFRLLDDNLNPIYDFGPSEPVAAEVIEGLLKAQAIQFRGVLGFRLPLRAQLTAWGQALLDGRI